MNPIIHIIRKAQIRANAPRIAANPNPYGVHIITDIPYRKDGRAEHLLDVYAPNEGKSPLPVIVELHGGTIEAKSEQGHMSFIITLPHSAS